MPKTTLYSRTGEDIGEVELSEELFAGPVNMSVLHQVVIAQLPVATSVPTTQEAWRGFRRRQEAVPQKERSRPPGLHSIAAVPRRWRGLRTASAFVRPAPAPPDAAARARRSLTSKLDDDAIRVIDAFGLEGPKTRDLVA